MELTALLVARPGIGWKESFSLQQSREETMVLKAGVFGGDE
jgi:hypothetical protein